MAVNIAKVIKNRARLLIKFAQFRIEKYSIYLTALYDVSRLEAIHLKVEAPLQGRM